MEEHPGDDVQTNSKASSSARPKQVGSNQLRSDTTPPTSEGNASNPTNMTKVGLAFEFTIQLRIHVYFVDPQCCC